MGGQSAPAPPDPKETAAGQTGSNISTAVANNVTGLIDQYTPYGNLEYDQTGTYTHVDPYTGQSYELPTWSATTSLNDAQQEQLNYVQDAETSLAALASEQAGFLRDYLPTAQDQTDQIGGQLFDIGRQRLDPLFGERRAALETQLANQGITAGSDAYSSQMRGLGEQENDAYNQLLLTGRGQAQSEANAPINRITALLSGSQINDPSVVMQSPQGFSPTDVSGIVNTNYNQQLASWDRNQSMLGGLFGGLGSIGAAALSSDRRLKADIAEIGAVKGLPVFAYRYLGSSVPQVGFMSDSVPEWAVVRDPDGYDRVRYKELLS